MIQVFKRKINVTSGDNPGEYYCAGYSRKGTSNSLDLAEQMKDGSSSFTKGEVVGVTLDLPARIQQALLDGKAVHINGLGTFKPSLTVSKVQELPEDLKTSAISIKSLNFKPDPELLANLNRKAQYEWISADKANSEDTEDDAPSNASNSQQTDGTQTDGTQTDGTQTDGNTQQTDGTPQGGGGNSNPSDTDPSNPEGGMEV